MVIITKFMSFYNMLEIKFKKNSDGFHFIKNIDHCWLVVKPMRNRGWGEYYPSL